ncbi:MAG: hypothetical protein ABSC94_27530 [Polyangiaceae bacterium]
MSATRKPFVPAVGAASQFAIPIVPELTQRGARAIGLVHDPAKADALRSRGP